MKAPGRGSALAWWALACLAAAPGCADAPPSVPSRARTGQLVGGSFDEAHRNVVALLVRTASGDEGLCSGVVVAPRVVLTAAHCVAPESVGQDASFSVFLGSDLGDAAQSTDPANRADVVHVAFDPEFDPQGMANGHDVAVAVTALPLPVSPLPLEPFPSLDAVTQVVLVGYGLSSSAAAEAGQRLEGSAALVSYDALFIELGDGTAPCLGDSGGAVLVDDGGERLAGIVSFTNTGCGPSVRATNLASYLPFVSEQIAMAAKSNEKSNGDSEPSCQASRAPTRTSSPWWILLAALVAGRLAAMRE